MASIVIRTAVATTVLAVAPAVVSTALVHVGTTAALGLGSAALPLVGIYAAYKMVQIGARYIGTLAKKSAQSTGSAVGKAVAESLSQRSATKAAARAAASAGAQLAAGSSPPVQAYVQARRTAGDLDRTIKLETGWKPQMNADETSVYLRARAAHPQTTLFDRLDGCVKAATLIIGKDQKLIEETLRYVRPEILKIDIERSTPSPPSSPSPGASTPAAMTETTLTQSGQRQTPNMANQSSTEMPPLSTIVQFATRDARSQKI